MKHLSFPVAKMNKTDIFPIFRFSLLLFCCWLFSVGIVVGQQPAANLDQIRNGSAASPVSPGDWQNGNLGPSNSHYAEGMSVAYRVIMTDMPANTSVELILEYDIKHSGRHALDYLTHYDRIEPHQLGFMHDKEDINPTIGTPYFASPTPTPTSEFHFSAPPVLNSPVLGQPTNSFNMVSAAGGAKMSMWGGTIDDITYGIPVVNGDGDLGLTKAAQRIIVDFTTGPTDGQTIVLAWGGHIGSRNDWGFDNGVPRSAGGISGSPYHMRLIDWDLNNLGNQDRSLKANAVIPPPECILGGPELVCGGTQNDYTVSASNAPNPTYLWELLNNTSGASIASGQGSTTLKVNAGTGGGYTVKVTVSDINGMVTCDKDVTVSPLPAAPNTTGDSRCGPGVVNLSASGCTGGTLKWYDAAMGGMQVNTGSNFSPNINTTTSYWVSCTSADGCEGPRKQVTGTIFDIPAAPNTTGDSRCGPGVVNLSASGCDGTLKWYDAAMGGMQVNTGSNFSPNINATTSYWVSCTSADGCEGPRKQVTGTVFDVPAAPNTTGDSRCGPGVVNLSASGCDGTLKWYDAAMGGMQVNTGTNFSPNINTTTSYWVSCTNSDGCEGPRKQVTGTVFDVPAAPNTTGDSRCGPGVVNLSASGCDGTLKWYDAAMGGMQVNTGSNFSPDINATTSYWVSCTSADGCEGPRQQVTGTIFDVPAAPNTTGDSRCGPGVVNLSASGCDGTLKWYDAAMGGMQVNTGSNFSPDINATTSYWVSCTSADGCEGPRQQVTGTVFDIPAAPNTTGDSRCGPGVVNLSASGCDGTLKWYDAAMGGTQVNTGSNFSPDINTTTSYWVSCTSADGCEGPRQQVTGTIFDVPAAPNTTGDSRCGPGVVNLSASGCDGTLKWYDAAMGGMQVNTGPNFSPNINTTTSYWVSCTNSDGCEGPRQQVSGVVFTITPEPSTTDDSRCGPGEVTLTASACDGGTLTWYDAAMGGTVVATGPTFSPTINASTTYYVSCTSSDGCEGPREEAIATVFDIPSAPNTTGDSRCGPGVVNLSASGCTGGTLKWYDAAMGGMQVNTGTNFSPDINTTTSYWVSCTSADGCEGPRKQVTGTIFDIPAAPNTTGDSRCGPGVVNLSASGCDGTLKWYDAAMGGTQVNTGSNFSPNINATTSYWVSCTNSDGCEGPRKQVTGTIKDFPTVMITDVGEVCVDDPAFQMTVSVDPGGGTGSWSSVPAGAISAGGLFDPSAGTGTYVVTYNYTAPNGCPGSDETTVEVVLCHIGCAYTPGYWKNHPEDICQNTITVDCDQGDDLEINVLSALSDNDDNPWTILARAYTAAWLNHHCGAGSWACIIDDIQDAEDKLCSATKEEAATFKNGPRNQWTRLADRIDDFNNGNGGNGCPGSCSQPLPLISNNVNNGINTEQAGPALRASDYIDVLAYPNPSSGDINITYLLAEDARVRVTVYSLLGARVATLFEGEVVGGVQQMLILERNGLTAGTYIYRIETQNHVHQGKIQLMD